MPSTSSQTLKLKSTLRLLIPRLRMAQKKDTSLSIASRREMAALLEQNREASARIRVENIIQTDICVELMEILELYAELLLARAGLLDKTLTNGSSSAGGGAGSDIVPDTGLEEAAASIIYAAPRLPREVRELGIVRGLLVERFGKEFGVRAQENRDNLVPARVVDKLKVEPPRQELVTAYLAEIARTYGVDWPPHREEEDEGMDVLRREVDDEMQQNGVDNEDGRCGGGGQSEKEAPISNTNTSTTPSTRDPATPSSKNTSTNKHSNLGRAFDRDELALSRATPPRDIAPAGAKSPVSVAPPGPRTDNPSPKVRLPDGGAAVKKTPAVSAAAPSNTKAGAAVGGGKPLQQAAAPTQKKKDDVVGGAIPTVDDLAKRFAQLKR